MAARNENMRLPQFKNEFGWGHVIILVGALSSGVGMYFQTQADIERARTEGDRAIERAQIESTAALARLELQFKAEISRVELLVQHQGEGDAAARASLMAQLQLAIAEQARALATLQATLNRVEDKFDRQFEERAR